MRPLIPIIIFLISMPACESPTQETMNPLNHQIKDQSMMIDLDQYDAWFHDFNTDYLDDLGRDLNVVVNKEQIQQWITNYDQNRTSLDMLLIQIQEHHLESTVLDQDIRALQEEGLSDITLLNGKYSFDSDISVLPTGILLIAAGSEIEIASQKSVHIQGRLFVLGTETNPVRMRGKFDDDEINAEYMGYKEILVDPNYEARSTQYESVIRYSGLSLAYRLLNIQNSTPHKILVQYNQFDQWSDKAIAFKHSDGLRIEWNRFAMYSSDFEGLGEAIRGFSSAARIQYNLFGPMQGYRDAIDLEECSDPHIPWVVQNRFLGGQDDGIDLDACSAYIINNHISHFLPPMDRPFSGGVNGGGITGDRGSEPVLIGNVIDQCYHAIGFKDGAKPVLINNTITRSHIGFTLYRSRSDRLAPSAKIINTLWMDNDHDIRLDGAWWPLYDPQEIDLTNLEVSTSYFISDQRFAHTSLADYNMPTQISSTWNETFLWSLDESLTHLTINQPWGVLSPLLEIQQDDLDLWPKDLLDSPCPADLYLGALQAHP